MAISVCGVRKAYFHPGGYRTVLDNVDLSVRRGEVVGLAGINGAGKSTLIKIILGVLRPDRGSVSVGKGRRDSIGFLREGGYDFFEDLTVEQNLQYFCGFYGVGKFSRSIEIQHRIRNYKLESLLSKRVSKLSRGQKQILSIINATLHLPDVIILDEPTLGLDHAASGCLRDEVADSKQRGAATLIATHDFAFLDDVCDRIAVLHDGDVAFLETAMKSEDVEMFEIRYIDDSCNQFSKKRARMVYKGELCVAIDQIGLDNIYRITNVARDPLSVYKGKVAR